MPDGDVLYKHLFNHSPSVDGHLLSISQISDARGSVPMYWAERRTLASRNLQLGVG